MAAAGVDSPRLGRAPSRYELPKVWSSLCTYGEHENANFGPVCAPLQRIPRRAGSWLRGADVVRRCGGSRKSTLVWRQRYSLPFLAQTKNTQKQKNTQKTKNTTTKKNTHKQKNTQQQTKLLASRASRGERGLVFH